MQVMIETAERDVGMVVCGHPMSKSHGRAHLLKSTRKRMYQSKCGWQQGRTLSGDLSLAGSLALLFDSLCVQSSAMHEHRQALVCLVCRHPLMQRLIHQLPRWQRSFLLRYWSIMLSTGPM